MPVLADIFNGSPCIADIIHVANVLYLVSYCVRDIFWLRILTVVAGLALLPYYFTCGSSPLWPAIIWSGLFLVVNLYQILVIVKERWPRALHGPERELYDSVFSDLTPGEFVKLLSVGDWRTTTAGETLVEDGSVVKNMMVLTSGAAEVRKGDKVFARLKPGQFVGEMSFLTGEKAGASVMSPGVAKVMSWPHSTLDKFLAKNGALSFKVRGVLGRDVVAKLRAH
jgi:hypothetical protein